MKLCPFCAEEIQDAAIKCRWCGEMMPGNGVTAYTSPPPLPDPTPAKPQQKSGQASESGCTSVFIVTAIIVLAIICLSFIDLPSSHPVPPTRNDQITSQFNSSDGSHRRVVEYVKSGLKNPASFEHVRTTYTDNSDHLYIEMTYRGTNGFGGVVTETYRANVSLDGRIMGVDK